MATRSIKSELYKFIKTIIEGGTYTDANDDNQTYTFAGISAVKHYDFWNQDLDKIGETSAIPCPAVLYEYNVVDTEFAQLRTSEYNVKGNVVDVVQITLHVIVKKVSAANISENNYLDCIDLVETIRQNIEGRHFLGITDGLRKVSEVVDVNSQTLMDGQITFTCKVTNCAITDSEDSGLTPPVAIDLSIDSEQAPIRKEYES